MPIYPLLLPPHQPYIWIPCPYPPNIAVRSVPTPSVQPKVNSATYVVDTITSQHCASSKVANRQPSRPCKEAISLQDTVLAVIMELHVVPVTPVQTLPLYHHSTSRTPSHSPSCSPSHSTLPWHFVQSNRHSTPHRYFQDALEVIPADSITSGSQAKGKLYTESTSNGQVAFYTHLQLPACHGTKTMTVKIGPGAEVNTIPLSRYHVLFPKKLTKSRFPKAKALLPTHHTWISHDGLPKPFLGHFVVQVLHATVPKTYPVCFYVFEDATSLHILLS